MDTFYGTVTKAYSPKRGKTRFFFMLNVAGQELKGMAPSRFLGTIIKGAEVRVTGTVSKSGWLNPKDVEVVNVPTIEAERLTFRVDHVGHPRQTHHGWACSTKVGDEWFTITCAAIGKHFAESSTDLPVEFPRMGRGTMEAMVKRNGDVVVTEILRWEPTTMEVKAVSNLCELDWWPKRVRFPLPGDMLWIPVDQLPFEYDPAMLPQYKRSKQRVKVEGHRVAVSQGPNSVEWEWLDYEVTMADGDAETFRRLLWTERVKKATKEVRDEIADLTSRGVVLDVTAVVELFLKQGVQVENGKAREILESGYDQRYLEVVKELATGSTWLTADGFLVECGDWVVWERCGQGTATYVLPSAPQRDLEEEEWISVLGRVLPEANLMDVRYGEVGQTLTGTSEGPRFVIHRKDSEGGIERWADELKLAVEREPVSDAAVPDLALLLEAA